MLNTSRLASAPTATLASLVFLIGWSLCWLPCASASTLELRFLDVGQGDAILLSDGDHSILVDAGCCESRISDKVARLGVTSFDIVVASHNHRDHIGGIPAVLRLFSVRYFLDNGRPTKTKLEEEIFRLLEARSVAFWPDDADEITLGDTKIRILRPPGSVGGDAQNNGSIGLVVTHGSFSALLTGDSEVEELNAWLSAGVVPRVNVLKAAHHGSRNGVTPLWLQRANPDVVVVSVGEHNEYHHPDPMALRYYEAGGRRVLRTDREGDIDLMIEDSGAIAISTTRGGGVTAP